MQKNAYQKRGLTVNYWQKQHLLFFAGQTDIETGDQLSKLSIVNTIKNKRMQKIRCNTYYGSWMSKCHLM